MSIIEKLKNTLVPSLYAAGAGTAIYYAFVDNDLSSPVPLAGMNVPVAAAVFGSVFVGNSVGEILTQFVVPYLPESGDLKKIEDMVLPPAMAGLSSYLFMRTFVSEGTDMKNALLIGSGGSLAGGYLYNYTM